MKKIKILLLILIISNSFSSAQKLLDIEVSCPNDLFKKEVMRIPEYPPINDLFWVGLKDMANSSDTLNEYLKYWKLQYRLYDNFLKQFRGKEIKSFTPIKRYNMINLENNYTKKLWVKYAKKKHMEESLETISLELYFNFEKWIKSNYPHLVHEQNMNNPILYFEFKPDKIATYYIDSLYIKTIAIDQGMGGAEAKKIRRIEIEILSTPGGIVTKKFDKKINVYEEDLCIRFITPRNDHGYREIGNYLVELVFSYFADGEKKYFNLDPFWLTFSGRKN